MIRKSATGVIVALAVIWGGGTWYTGTQIQPGVEKFIKDFNDAKKKGEHVNRPGFPGECFICELRLPDHRFRWKHNKLFLLLPEEYGPAFPAIVDCYTSPPT